VHACGIFSTKTPQYQKPLSKALGCKYEQLLTTETPMKTLYKLIKTIFKDLRAAAIALGLASLLASGVWYLNVKNLLHLLKDIMLAPTPLWATTLALLIPIYIYIKNRKNLHLAIQKEEHEELINTYRLSLSLLSAFVAISDENSVPSSEKVNLIKEIQYNTSLILSKNLEDREFQCSFNDFSSSPGKKTACDLLDEMTRLLKLSSTDREKGDQKQKVITGNQFVTKETDLFIVSIKADEQYIKEEHVNKGVIVKPDYQFKIKLQNITKSQRKKLMAVFGPLFNTIPNYLYLPLEGDKSTKSGTSRYGLPCANFSDNNYWKAKINPERTSPKVIMKKWEQDFDEANKS